MEFEIINPSDEAYLEAEDFETACIASMLVTESHGLKQVDGDLTMPPIIFAQGWFLDQFKETPKEGYERLDRKEVIKVLRSHRLAGERTSMRDFVSYAHKLADELEEKYNLGPKTPNPKN